MHAYKLLVTPFVRFSISFTDPYAFSALVRYSVREINLNECIQAIFKSQLFVCIYQTRQGKSDQFLLKLELIFRNLTIRYSAA